MPLSSGKPVAPLSVGDNAAGPLTRLDEVPTQSVNGWGRFWVGCQVDAGFIARLFEPWVKDKPIQKRVCVLERSR